MAKQYISPPAFSVPLLSTHIRYIHPPTHSPSYSPTHSLEFQTPSFTPANMQFNILLVALFSASAAYANAIEERQLG